MTATVPADDKVFVEPIGAVLTAEEYDALPDNPRRELVDGVLRIMATPPAWHQRVKSGLYHALHRRRLREVEVIEQLEVRLADQLRRNPDVLVVRADDFDWQTARVPPSQVILAVEVVAPGSHSEDRVLKPRQYANAGIEHFWQVETVPDLVVHTFRLGDAGYVPNGVFNSGDVINTPGLPWAQVPVDELTS